jgi:NAD(P)-dependent dehydrogenase (short-subunit alcohol dehydrogenase family)
VPGSAAVSLVNAGIEGLARAAALEAPRRIRVNAISPPWVTEALQALKMDLSEGPPAGVGVRAYVRSVTGTAPVRYLSPLPSRDANSFLVKLVLRSKFAG